jgi:Leucine-rich repeat (LRR) protein
MISFSLLSLATLFQPSLTLTPSSQIQGLEFLFNSTNGTHWRWRPEALNGPKWTFSVPQPDPCNDKNKAWQGITCSSTPSVCRTQDCEIVALTLTSYDLAGSLPANFFSMVSSLTSLQISSSQNLTGSIPSDIGLLSQLSQISLDSNELTGSIPSEICLLNKLKIFFAPSNGFTGTLPNELNSLSLLNLISLYSNRLTGSIPSQLGLLSQLNFLALYSNQFTGTVPSELGSLIRMNFLYLDSNQLNGTIPSALSSLSLLRELFLHSNQLSGSIPPELGSLSRLSYLYLYFNRLTGPIPPELGALSQLNYLSLNTNYLTGPIPSGLGLLSRLRQLYLYFNELTAPIPPELGSLSLLNQLFLYGNHLSGPLPPELISLTQLNSLSLYFNQISGSIPSGLSSLSLLSELYLHSNQLSGTIPSTLSALSQLISLSLNSNQLTGSIPPELSLLSRLNELDLFYNRLTGIIPPEFTLLSQLNSLTLAENDLTGPMPPELSSLLQLMVLFLDGNRLTGTIPSVISSLSLLRFFSLNFNRFSGAIPPELSSLSRLEFFELSFNQFSGTIPPELTRISQLKNLDLAFNQLTGTLSDELSLLSQLVNGYLHSNRFSGTIPSSLSLLSRLNFLSLNSNDFTGTIPSQLSSLSRLRYLYLYSNHLTGTIPPSFASSLLDLIYLLLSSNSLTGPIPSQIGLLTSLEELDLSQNSLTGSIPSSIVNLKNLIRLRFYQNILRGEISFSLASFPRLQQLFLHQNRFYGRLQQLFSPTSNHSLLNLDLSDNRFSGSVPSQLFLLPHLQSISLSLNCFEHKLPLSMCQAVGVGVISMSGLGASSSCQHVVTVPFTSVSLVQTMDGSIPDCVWLLSNVKILNLAGNGLTGTIGETSRMPFLLSLTLSHNYLRGTIPSWLQEKNMSQLDLSHNKLTGTLDGFKSQGEGIDFGLVNRSLGSRFLDQTLKLSVNRLSGDLSFSLKKYATLDILSGNLFGCARIPRNDKNSEWEVCGSEEYDQSLIVMGGVCGLIVLVTAFYGLCLLISSFTLPPVGGKAMDQQQAEDSKISTERSPSSSNSSLWFERRLLEHRAAAIRFVRYFYFTDLPSSPSIRSFGFLLSNLTRSVCLLTFLSLILSFPIYVLKVLDKESQDGGGSTEDEAQYITHSHMYRWLWTVAFVSGTVPSVLLLTVTFLCLMFFCFILTVLGVDHDSPRSVQELEMKDERDPERVDHLRDTSVAIPDEVPQLATPVGRDTSFDGDPNEFLVSGVWVILLANIAVVGTVNGLYLWSTLLDLSNLMRILIQFSFGLFTFVWRVLILRGGLPTRLKESRYGVRLFTYLNIVNTVIIPCVVTALSDPSCYQVTKILISPIHSLLD